MEIRKINLPFKIKTPVLALGSQVKNTLCFAHTSLAYLSPVHQDLGELKSFLDFKRDAKGFLKKNPRLIACDLHQDYQSTKFGQGLTSQGLQLKLIQHHHAHIASCMADNGLKNQKVIGVAFDGTGLGSEGKIWGAEFLICDYKDFYRAGHLKEVALIGGEKAILEPWRLVAAWRGFLAPQDKILKKIYQANLNCPLASSMGRLFDAAGSLILGKRNARFEAELAIELENIANSIYHLQPKVHSYNFKIERKEKAYILNPDAMFKEISADLKAGKNKAVIAYKFHLTIAKMIEQVCLRLKKESKLNKVALSGGVFQNKLLLSLAQGLLCEKGFLVFKHRNISCNDSGISLGQAVIAGF
ncbi:MAG: carbamoyltransferase HypF [Candidatus Omnitrophica bacterium]|nr:carbamoyltransferase HypF [Candidatus Omnitrophota bacterium]